MPVARLQRRCVGSPCTDPFGLHDPGLSRDVSRLQRLRLHLAVVFDDGTAPRRFHEHFAHTAVRIAQSVAVHCCCCGGGGSRCAIATACCCCLRHGRRCEEMCGCACWSCWAASAEPSTSASTWFQPANQPAASLVTVVRVDGCECASMAVACVISPSSVCAFLPDENRVPCGSDPIRSDRIVPSCPVLVCLFRRLIRVADESTRPRGQSNGHFDRRRSQIYTNTHTDRGNAMQMAR